MCALISGYESFADADEGADMVQIHGVKHDVCVVWDMR